MSGPKRTVKIECGPCCSVVILIVIIYILVQVAT